MTKEIYSVEIEANIIAAILKNQEYYLEVSNFLNENDFYLESHKIIFMVMLRMINSQETLDKLNVAQRVKEIGISLEVSPFEYLRSLSVRSINIEGFLANVKELKKLSVRRNLREDFIKSAKEMENASNLSYNEIIAKAEESFNNTINIYNYDNEPTDLFLGAEEKIEEIGNNPIEEVGLKSPYPTYNRLFGGFCKKELYVFAGNAKGGKSTVLADAEKKIVTECNLDKDIKALHLDTEMTKDQVMFRNVAAISGVSDWMLKTGLWRKNKELMEKVRAAWAIIKKYYNKIDHIYIGDKSIDEICSISRRWKNKKVKKNQEGIIIFDYIKLITDQVSSSHPEHYLIGQHTMKLKQLAGELDAPILAAVQLNRIGQASQSQRISWFCSCLFHVEKWTPEEQALWGNKNGTHKLTAKFTRNLGQYADEAGKLVQYTDARGEKQIVEDWINLEFNNFNVEDKGTLSQMLKNTLNLAAESTVDNGQLLED